MIPKKPEKTKSKKKWIQDRFKDPPYRETVDQPKMTSSMDLSKCQERSPSFDKLCRELAKVCQGASLSSGPVETNATIKEMTE